MAKEQIVELDVPGCRTLVVLTWVIFANAADHHSVQEKPHTLQVERAKAQGHGKHCIAILHHFRCPSVCQPLVNWTPDPSATKLHVDLDDVPMQALS